MSMPRRDALNHAVSILDRLEPHCERIEVAGSIRRQAETVKDIEIVCVPRLVVSRADLFGNPVDYTNPLEDYLDDLRAEGVVADRLDKNGRPAWGDRYKRMLWNGIAVDLFTVLPPSQWGMQLLIRTGPHDFSRLMMTQRFKRGMLPNGIYANRGSLWHRTPPDDQPIETPEESDVFEIADLPYIEPVDRSIETLRRLSGRENLR